MFILHLQDEYIDLQRSHRGGKMLELTKNPRANVQIYRTVHVL